VLIDASMALQVLINLGGLAAIYTGLKVQIAVLSTKVGHLEAQIKTLQTK
jgi:hypothetical protein